MRCMVRWLVALAALAAPACMDWESGIPCRTERHCPAGSICQDGVCAEGIPVPDAGGDRVDGGAGRG
jgi:hypothetical protein